MAAPILLSLTRVAERPELVERFVELSSGRRYELRALTSADEGPLHRFLGHLSPRTRRFYSLPDESAPTAAEWCAAIARYDKLRLIVLWDRDIVGILEFSFDLPATDIGRFLSHGYALDATTDCRIGVCLADEHQDLGLGSALLLAGREIARRFGRRRLLLWGGVLQNNGRAIAAYRATGFRVLGRFIGATGEPSLDMILE